MAYLSQLRTFVAAYRLGSLTKAAEQLAITQPAASKHIRLLESHIQKPLFVRHARGLVPTVIAHDLAQAIAPHIDGIEDGFRAVQASTTSIAGTIHIAGPGEYLSAKVIPQLAGLTAEGIRVRLHPGGRERIYTLLQEGIVDLAITASQPDSRALDYQVIDRETLVLVAAPTWIQQTLGDVFATDSLMDNAVTQLMGQSLIAYDDELSLIRQYFDQVFQENLKVQAAVTVSDLRMVRSLVVNGQGYSVLPQYLCESALQSGELTALYRPSVPPTNSLYLVWNRDQLSHPCVAFARKCFLTDAKQP